MVVWETAEKHSTNCNICHMRDHSAGSQLRTQNAVKTETVHYGFTQVSPPPSKSECGVCGCYVMLSPHNNWPIRIKTAFGITFPRLFGSTTVICSSVD